MKTYDDLNKEQKERLHAYLLMRSYTKKGLLLLTLLVYMFIATSLVCFSMWSIPSVVIGAYGFVVSILLLAILYAKATNESKVVNLIFNVENMDEDFFEIQKSDLLNMKRRWIK